MGVDIIAQLSRKNSANFPLAAAEDIIGAFVTVPNTTARDAIPTAILRQGAIARIGNTSNYYEWTGSAWSLLSFGGSSGHIVKDEGTPVSPRAYLNFVGVNVAVTDDGTNTVVTVGQVSLSAGVTGVLPVVNGGTGLSTGGTAGQVLTWVSGAPAWSSPSGGALSAPASPGDNNKLAIASSGNLTYAYLTDINVSALAAIAPSKLADGSACSVLGRSANTSGAYADIASTADDQVFRRSGGVLGWGTIATAGIGDSQVTLPKLANGSAVSIIGRAQNTSGTYADIQFAADNDVLMRTAGIVTSGKIANANITVGTIGWDKLSSAIGNLAFTGLKAITFNGEIATTGATPAVDWTTGALQKTTLTANATPTFTAPVGPGPVFWHVVQNGTGGWTIAFPASIKGNPPQPNTAANSETIYALYYDGTNYWPSALLPPEDAQGADLTDVASTTINVSGGTEYNLRAGTLTTARGLILGTGGSPEVGEQFILNLYAQGSNYTVTNGGALGGTLYTHVAGNRRKLICEWNGANWLPPAIRRRNA